MMEDYSKRAPFRKIPVTPDGKNANLLYCGDCLNFVPDYEGAMCGMCSIMNVFVCNHWCCSVVKDYKPIAGHQLELFG